MQLRSLYPLNLWPGAVLLLGGLLNSPVLFAESITIAVASNFAETLDSLVVEFEQQLDHDVTLIRGSSGRHYAQITNGAPFDLFLSADSTRPARLVADGRVEESQIRSYAIGQLVLLASDNAPPAAIRAHLAGVEFRHLAMANPRLAPYGQAAIETLENMGLGGIVEQGRVVMGENVAQAYQFVSTGNAELGFVALSQTIRRPTSSYWLVPQDLYSPIIQQLAVLRESTATRDFIAFLSSPAAQVILKANGYLLPQD